MAFKFDLLFEITVPRPWTEGKERNRFHEALEQAIFAEQMGFDTTWIVEHHFLSELAHSSAPEVWLGALAVKTSRMRIGYGVTLLPGHVNHPIRVAERTAVTDIMCDGRLEVGTGRSTSPYQLEAFGCDIAKTRDEWEEAIKLLPSLWTEEDFSYSGKCWSWTDKITVVPRPVQKPHPPLWVASTQPDTCRLAGEKGIGLLLPAIERPEGLADRIQAYKRAVASPTDQIGHFKNDNIGLFTVGFCNDDDEKARALGAQGGQWYLNRVNEVYRNDWKGTPMEAVPDSYKFHAERKKRAQQTGKWVGGNWAANIDIFESEDPGQALVESGAFCVGDPDRIVETVRRYRAVGGDRLISVMQLADVRHEDIMRSIELFGRKVIPRVQAEEAAAIQVAESACP